MPDEYDDLLDTVMPKAAGPRRQAHATSYDPDTALSLIEQHESGGRNVPNFRFDKGHTAQGHYQITNTNWKNIGPQVGVDLKQYPSAMAAPKEVQAQVAKAMYTRRGFADWAPYNPSLRQAIGRGDQPRQVTTPKRDAYDDLLDEVAAPPASPLARGRVTGGVGPVRLPRTRPVSRADLEKPTYEAQRGQPATSSISSDEMRIMKGEQPVDRTGRAAPPSSPQGQAEARLGAMQNRDAQRAQVEHARWQQQNAQAIADQTAEYRADIQKAKAVGGDANKWVAEMGTKGATGLMEMVGGVLKPVDAELSNKLRVHVAAAQQAAEAEGADRGVVSKTLQDIAGGFVATAPELAAMGAGVPAPAVFGAGAGLRAYGGERPVVPAVAHGAATGAAFEVPMASRLGKAATVGGLTTGIDVVSGQPIGEAAKSGAVNALMAGATGGARESKPMDEGLGSVPESTSRAGEVPSEPPAVGVANEGLPPTRHVDLQRRLDDGTFGRETKAEQAARQAKVVPPEPTAEAAPASQPPESVSPAEGGSQPSSQPEVSPAVAEKPRVITAYRGANRPLSEAGYKTGAVRLTSDPEYAKLYGKHVIPAEVDLKNPLVVKGDEGYAARARYYDLSKDDIDALKSQGHDGILIEPKTGSKFTGPYEEVIAFEKTQVKEKPPTTEPVSPAVREGRTAAEPAKPAAPETKPSKLAQGVEAKAVEAKLTEGFEPLRGYTPITVKDQAQRALKLLDENPGQARQIAMGDADPPQGVHPESVFTAVENRALANGDVSTLMDLATKSTRASEDSVLGQRIRMLKERNPNSPVAAISKVEEVRAARVPKKRATQARQKIKTEIEVEMRQAAPKAKDWAGFLESIVCK